MRWLATAVMGDSVDCGIFYLCIGGLSSTGSVVLLLLFLPPLPACSSCTSCSQVEYHFNRRALETNLVVLQELVALRAELASVSGLLPCVSVNASFSSHQPDEGEQGWYMTKAARGPRSAHQPDKPHRTMD